MEEFDFQGLLDRFHQGGFTRGEAIILANFGTNQTMLSLIFGKPCRLKLGDQGIRDGVINRQTFLYYGDVVGCIANTKIPLNRNRRDVIDLAYSSSMGLGQIVVHLNLPSRRNLLDIGRDREGFWRTYAIEGPEVYLEIHEHFSRLPLLAVGWDCDYGESHGK